MADFFESGIELPIHQHDFEYELRRLTFGRFHLLQPALLQLDKTIWRQNSDPAAIYHAACTFMDRVHKNDRQVSSEVSVLRQIFSLRVHQRIRGGTAPVTLEEAARRTIAQDFTEDSQKVLRKPRSQMLFQVTIIASVEWHW